MHMSGKASRYTRGRLPVKYIATNKCSSHKEALKMEREVKKLPKSRKLQPFFSQERNLYAKDAIF